MLPAGGGGVEGARDPPASPVIKSGGGGADAGAMGDVLRRIFYPLLLPAIVACVWAHAWAVKQEAATARTSLPLPSAVVVPHGVPAIHFPGSAYGFSADDEVASVGEDAE